MATTPSRLRQSTSRIGIPTPVKSSSAIPTPGRSRSSSRAGQPIRAPPQTDPDSDIMTRAFQQAIRSRNPTKDHQEALTPATASHSARPGSVASTSSATSAITPRSSLARPKTPTQVRSVQNRPQSRQSDVFRASSRAGAIKVFEPGDPVRIESLGFEGTLKYVGAITGKSGTWAGVELGPGFAGLGKNDGSVDGTRYFDCPPKGGVFVALNKLSLPPIRRPTSVTSHIDGRSTPANSASGRSTPLYNTPSARSRQSKPVALLPPPPNDKFSIGSRASKYANMTAERLRNAANNFNNSPSLRGIPSPSRDLSPSRQGRRSPTRTPKPSGRHSRPSEGLASPVRIDFVTPKPVSRSSISGSSESPRRSTNSLTGPDSPLSEPEDSSSLTELQRTVENQRVKIEALEAERVQANEEGRTNQQELARLSTSLQSAESRIKEVTEIANKVGDLESTIVEQDASLKSTENRLEEMRVALSELQSSASATEESLKSDVKQSEERVKILEQRALETDGQHNSEKKRLNSQIDELRAAGQETIALYEDRLSANEDRRYELEELVSSLQERVAAATRPLSPATMAKHASEAAQIDNESLREQNAHLQKRINLLEEKLEDARATADSEEASLQLQLDKHRETEASLRKDVEVLMTRIEEEKRESSKVKGRTVEMEEALKENAAALENTRAEVESLRTELTIWQNSGEGTPNQMASESTEAIRLEMQKLQETAVTTANSLTALQQEHSELRDEYQAATEKAHLLTQISEELQSTINEQQVVIDKLRGEAKSSSSSPEKDVRSSRHDLAEKREEIVGLKRIVQQLSQDNAALNSQVKIIEAERNLLMSETEQLRDELKSLEYKVESSLFKENSLSSPIGGHSSSPSNTTFEMENAELKRKLVEQEQRTARIVHDLNKEISELETLVESKIYREDELERELERYKERASRSSKKPRPSNKHALENQEYSPETSMPTNGEDAVTSNCEICEQPGHDIFTCPILQGDKAAKTPPTSQTHLWCEDCERPGHTSANCPHSMDVF